ncbi:hypothetical protein [Bradyrhizobium iriomotense]|uniref:Uncharacterized protein n=1 Tax=Bradyrhizobium iriomotense TaxID=441950 RepID=A0ABQ6BDC9_9BRAD|nr:hypothetical protein [Bradyrhizobium iriomotense]GLR90651.1 hypothetical protein GCM10007857_73660 [Bradyrhizobium iriomotense]
MPILRYFMYVGGALLALLFAVNLGLPEAPVAQNIVTSSNEAPLIRIRSDRKLPERVVLDTSQATIAPPAPAKTAGVATQPPAQPNASPALGDMSAKARVRESFAQFTPTEPKGDAASVKKPVQPKRKVARRSPPPYYYGQPTYFGQPTFGGPVRMAQQPHFGLFNTTW